MAPETTTTPKPTTSRSSTLTGGAPTAATTAAKLVQCPDLLIETSRRTSALLVLSVVVVLVLTGDWIAQVPIRGALTADSNLKKGGIFLRTAPTMSSGDGHFICQKLRQSVGGGTTVPTATSVWFGHLQQILNASQLSEYDRSYAFRDVTAYLLRLLSPRLHRAAVTAPRDMQSVRRVLDVLQARWEYLTSSDDDRGSSSKYARPLRVLVLGGSPTAGVKCPRLGDFDASAPPTNMSETRCAWANRLHSLVNRLFSHGVSGDGGDRGLVQIVNAAIGGTNSPIGTLMFKYGIVPEEGKDPDIVIHAYMGNDAYEPATILSDAEMFVRTVLESDGPCRDGSPPLLLHVSDYLGNGT